MRSLMLLLAIFSLGPTTTTLAATVKPMLLAEVEAKCRAELDTFDGEKRRSRTGYSFEQDMAFCIKQKISK